MCITGIPTTKDENLKQIISEIGTALNLEVTEGDVLQAHRMQSNTKKSRKRFRLILQLRQ